MSHELAVYELAVGDSGEPVLHGLGGPVQLRDELVQPVHERLGLFQLLNDVLQAEITQKLWKWAFQLDMKRNLMVHARWRQAQARKKNQVLLQGLNLMKPRC